AGQVGSAVFGKSGLPLRGFFPVGAPVPPFGLDWPTMVLLAPAAEGLAFSTAPLPTTLLSCAQSSLLRANPQAAPTPPLSLDAPSMTTLPSADSATESGDFPTAPMPTNFLSCLH